MQKLQATAVEIVDVESTTPGTGAGIGATVPAVIEAAAAFVRASLVETVAFSLMES